MRMERESQKSSLTRDEYGDLEDRCEQENQINSLKFHFIAKNKKHIF